MLADTLVLKYDVKFAEELAAAKAVYEERLLEEKKQLTKQLALELKNEGVLIEVIAKTTKLTAHEIECL